MIEMENRSRGLERKLNKNRHLNCYFLRKAHGGRAIHKHDFFNKKDK